MVSDDVDRGGLFGPVLSMQRSLVRGGLGVQRQIAEDVLEGLESLEQFSRRTRLSSHYAAVRAVDQIEEAHPSDEASLDTLYDGVGRTFETLADVDDRAASTVSEAVERTADATEELGERYLEVSETTCEPLVDRLGDSLGETAPEHGYGYEGVAADD
ncbi:hypothetical protein [Haloglomus litoreum]|uniref:hypothetical protein n=1 Tax=Haloglomus litoreum TaxID=3034026 RepID=UPI0023E79A6C|nr:hypothetical protein [Haloglomus sp. DT116]